MECSTLAFRVAFSVLRHREDAEDVAQEAFARAYRRFRQLRSRDRFRAWLVRMTWRLALDRQRADRRRLSREQAAMSLMPSESSGAAERTVHLWEAIDTLSEKLRMIVVLAAIEGHDMREVASIMGLPEGTVKSRLFLAFSLNVTVVMARYRDDTRVSSLPYSLTVTTGSRGSTGQQSQLRMGTELPVRAGSGEFTYRSVGSNIDARAATLPEEGRLQLFVTVNDNSVYEDDSPSGGAATASGQPVFRTFMASNTMILRDGQSTTFTAATDRVSSEVIRIEVTINVQP